MMEGHSTVLRNNLRRDVIDMDPIVPRNRLRQVFNQLAEQLRIQSAPRLRVWDRRKEPWHVWHRCEVE